MHNNSMITQHFCYAAFTHAMVDNNNSFRLCCLNETPMGSLNQSTFSEIWQSEKYQKVRQSMIDGKPIPGCEICYRTEQLGSVSDRQTYNQRYSDIFPDVNVATGNSENFPVSYDLRSSNLCNLKCLMCGPGSSHLISREILENQDLFSLNADNTGTIVHDRLAAEPMPLKMSTSWFQGLQESIVSTKPLSLTLLGGEPTVIPEYYNLLNKLIDANNTAGYLMFVTNLTNLNENFRRIITEFDSVDVVCSLDGFGKTVEYIRYPLNFEQWRTNFERLVEIAAEKNKIKPNSLRIAIHSVIQILNVHRLPDFIGFIKQYESYDFVRFSFNNVITGYGRGPFDLKYIDATERAAIVSRVRAVFSEELIKSSRLSNIIDQLELDLPVPSEQDWNNLTIFLLKRDIARGISVADYAPDVYKLIADRYSKYHKIMLKYKKGIDQ